MVCRGFRLKSALGLSLDLSLLLMAACRRQSPSSDSLPQSVYVWQQHWTPAVSEAVRRAGASIEQVQELVVLGAQLHWKEGKAVSYEPAVDWNALRESEKRIVLGIRMEAFPPGAGPAMACLFQEKWHRLWEKAAAHGVECTEVQLDYDCPQKRLAEYRALLPTLTGTARPRRFCITALPAWLGEKEFGKLVRAVDGFILQVHSVQTRSPGEAPALFEGNRARRWVQQAAAAERPFRVSLPTYSGLIGFAPDGRQLGMALDGEEPAWTADTRVVEFGARAEELALWVAAFQKKHPSPVEGIAWYRLPVGEGERNWRWPTFAAVLEGRTPRSHIEALAEGNGLVDISVLNRGEAETRFEGTVVLKWEQGRLEDGDALPGWSFAAEPHRATWKRTGERPPRLLPGGKQALGWARLHEPRAIAVEIVP